MIKVLLVEDDQLAQIITQYTLNQVEECNFDVTGYGEKAVDMCKENNYDLILMDIGLDGDMNGYVASEKIKAEGKNVHTPIVIITANESEEIKASSLSEIISYFAVKPLTTETVQTIFKNFIK